MIRRRSVREKLSFVFSISFAATLLITVGGFSGILLYDRSRSFVEELVSIAKVGSSTSRAALTFSDRPAAERILSAFASKPSITFAALVMRDGTILAVHGKRPQLPAYTPMPVKTITNWTADYVEVLEPVVLDNELIGYLRIRSGLDSFYRQIGWLLTLAGATSIFAVAVAFYFSRKLHTWVSEPLLSLKTTVQRVSQTKDYSSDLQATAEEDEVNQLIRSFNHMLKQLEERDRALSLAKERAEQTDKVKSMFLATMSHELRTPMHAILGMTEEVLETELTSEQRELLEIARSSAESLLSLINDVLDFSKIEAGKLALVPASVQIRTFIEKIIRMFAVSARRKQLTLALEVTEDVPSEIVADMNRLSQVLVNLIGNAVKFTNPGGSITVRVDTAGEDADRSEIFISVIDNGIGIPIEKVESIFEAFTQLKDTQSQPHPGTGLGLAIARRLVHLMGGTITVKSVVGDGSEFKLSIPCRAARPTAAGEKLSRTLTVSQEQAARTKYSAFRILVVEDNEVNLKLAIRVLEKRGYVVLVARNGRECIDVLRSNIPDLILMDLQMPEMDGWEATKAIRGGRVAVGKYIPIIAVTASALETDYKRCREAGMDAYLSKPLSKDRLFRTLDEFLLRDEDFSKAV